MRTSCDVRSGPNPYTIYPVLRCVCQCWGPILISFLCCRLCPSADHVLPLMISCPFLLWFHAFSGYSLDGELNKTSTKGGHGKICTDICWHCPYFMVCQMWNVSNIYQIKDATSYPFLLIYIYKKRKKEKQSGSFERPVFFHERHSQPPKCLSTDMQPAPQGGDYGNFRSSFLPLDYF